ncbi:MAG: hypothetical protein H0V05_16835 [Euzebyaceae bacterium]|nr:hypothetical protein [Euzebyaceae bacterium]
MRLQSLEAVEGAASEQDRILARAWLGRAYELRGDVTAALTFAEHARRRTTAGSRAHR